MHLGRRAIAEFIGTFWLVLCGCGAAVLASGFGDVGIGLLGVSFAFGLSVMTMAYALGHVSGCHLNPAVTVGIWAAGRFATGDVVPYMLAQVGGAIAASAVLLVIASGSPDFISWQLGTAANGYGSGSPGHYSLVACFIAEFVMTFGFLLVILAATDSHAPKGFAPIAIGLTLTLIHLVSIPVTNTSVNPARSTGPALFADLQALGQLWLFWAAPILGAVAGAMVYNSVFASAWDAPDPAPAADADRSLADAAGSARQA
jgi:aquaporin Z